MDRKEILDTAMGMINGSRKEDYGKPENSFQVIADLWNAYISGIMEKTSGDPYIEPRDVAAMLALLKIARIASGHAKSDNWIDLAGYAACGGELDTQDSVEVETSGSIECEPEMMLEIVKSVLEKITRREDEESNG